MFHCSAITCVLLPKWNLGCITYCYSKRYFNTVYYYCYLANQVSFLYLRYATSCRILCDVSLFSFVLVVVVSLIDMKWNIRRKIELKYVSCFQSMHLLNGQRCKCSNIIKLFFQPLIPGSKFLQMIVAISRFQ